MISQRIQTIIEELMNAESPITSEHLAYICQVSSRTIRSDLKTLEDFIQENGAEIRSIRGIGFELVIHDQETFDQFIQNATQTEKENANMLPIFQQDRIIYLIKRLLFAKGYQKLEDLADELFVSKSTLHSDMREVKSILAGKYGIVLHFKQNYGLRLEGSEFKLRVCIMDMLLQQIETMQDIVSSNHFPVEEKTVERIQQVIIEQTNHAGMALSDLGLNHLSMQLVIACQRIRNGQNIDFNEEELAEIIREKAFLIAKAILDELEDDLACSFIESEIAFFTLHLLGTKTIDISNHVVNTYTSIEGQIENLARKILLAIEKNLNISLINDKELFRDLMWHLKPSIYRYKYGIILPNPLLKDIKSNYPMAFQAAIFAGKVIKDELGISIHENDLGYLALHIGASIEKRNPSNQPKKVYIVNTSGISSIRMMVNRIESKFGSKIKVLGSTEFHNIDKIPTHSIDFIVSTIPLTSTIPVIEVNPIMSETDIQTIQNFVSNRHGSAVDFINEDLVFIGKDFQTREQVLKFLDAQLKFRGLVPKNYLEKVYERELASATSYGNLIALPHPIVAQTESTFLTVVVLKKPIDWGKEKVQLVILVNVEKNKNEDLQNMYKMIVKIAENKSIVQQLIKVKDYHEFIHILKK